jgi:hypothetical protein
MFDQPESLAYAALELLNMCNGPNLTPMQLSALELGAAVLCNHVQDWQEPENTKKKKDEFAQVFPEWHILRLISNGLKHPLNAKNYPNITKGKAREVEWEDDDFWYSDHNRKTLFVDVGGKQRSVSALVREFAMRYVGMLKD